MAVKNGKENTRERIINSAKQLFGIKDAANKLRKYLWWYLRRIEQAPLDAKIVYLFLKTNANFMAIEVYANVKKLYSHLLEIFEEGGKTGELKPGLNPRLARDIFVGTMDQIITRWLLKDLSFSIGCQCTMCGGNVQPLCVEICPDQAVRVQAGRPVVTVFLCEDCNECGGIRPDRAISVPVEKVTFYPAVENTHQAVSQGAAFGKAQPTLHRRLL